MYLTVWKTASRQVRSFVFHVAFDNFGIQCSPCPADYAPGFWVSVRSLGCRVWGKLPCDPETRVVCGSEFQVFHDRVYDRPEMLVDVVTFD